MDPSIYGPNAVIDEAREQNTGGCIHTGKTLNPRDDRYHDPLMPFSFAAADAYTCAAAGKHTASVTVR